MFQKAITLLCETPGHCLTKGCSKETEKVCESRAGWVGRAGISVAAGAGIALIFPSP